MASIGNNPEVAKARSRAGVAGRKGDQKAKRAAQADLAEAKIADYIERTVAAAPPLTDEQRDKLATLIIRGGAA